ncbi:radical SAM protein [Oribacterium sp. P6A1]|uniref:radical SAM protein n=1 Tax=Oribacterium sp. P6A1 TaxID=1410612 RepID=UPI00055DF2A5|nr:radical SAM protein [Oribacterium sp. P6A1]
MKKRFYRELRLRISSIVNYWRIVLVWLRKRLKLFIFSNGGFIKKYPSTIQLPITYKCNFNCKMCGMQKLIKNKDYSVEELEQILNDKLFRKVIAVGLNGGEPFLRADLVDCINVMLKTLPNLKRFNIISNGYFTDIIRDKLTVIYEIAKKKGVSVNLSLSVDGVGQMQDFMRGHHNAWEKVCKTLDLILIKKERYCDSLGVICTVTRFNVYNLEEVEAWSKKNNILVRYNIATINARINNDDRYEDFSIFCDEKARLVAQEFFYKKAIKECSETYFGIFLYIRDRKRYADCPCRHNDWVTLVPNGNISYCATYSNELGSALEKSAYDIFNGNIQILHEITTNHCQSCSHYISQLDSVGLRLFYEELLKNNGIVF